MLNRQFFTSLIFLFLVQITSAQIKYSEANNDWDADSLGNQRAVVDFKGPGKTAFVKINWRRRDSNPENIKIIVQDAKTLQLISHVKVLAINREFGKILFDPFSGPGRYYIYYLPYKNEGRSNYPHGVYLKPDGIGSAGGLPFSEGLDLRENAFCNEIQSIDSFNRVYPMEVI